MSDAAPVAPAQITIEQFVAVDLRVAKIVDAFEVPEARKLIKLQLDIGGGVMKTCFAGIKEFYEVKDMIGKTVIFVNNLQPRQMKFGLSEGMILAASNEGHKELKLVTAEDGSQPGWKIS